MVHLARLQADVTTDERIERHLMRQRGAGSRTVNADFGFSFAGFSAPVSQEATPSNSRKEPPAKRRRTIGEDAHTQPQKAKTTALDRREHTKARQLKRRFVADIDEEATRQGRRMAEEGDDSFVAGVAAKRQAREDPDSAARAIQAGSLQAVEDPFEPKKATQAKAPRAPSRRKGGRRAKGDEIVEDTADGLAEVAKPIPEADQKSCPRRRATGKRKPGAMGTGHLEQTMKQHLQEAPSAPAVNPLSKIRKAAPIALQKQALEEDRHASAPEDETRESSESHDDRPNIKTRARRLYPASKAQGRDPMPEVHPGDESSNKAVVKAKIKGKIAAQQVATAEQTDASVESTQPGSDHVDAIQSEPSARLLRKKTKQIEKSPARASKRRHMPLLQDDDENVGGEPTSEKAPEKLEGKKKNVGKAVLNAIPSRLERRALQETDANRSPSPRKSAGKAAERAGDQPGESHTNVKRKRLTKEGDSGTSQKPQRKSRKLAVQRDEAPEAAGDPHAGPELKPEKGDDPHADADASPRKREDVSRPAMMAKARKAAQSTHPTATRPKRSAEEKSLQNAKKGIEGEGKDEDEDIDWLFTAPQTRPAGPVKLHAAEPPPALSRKTRLADIDLDELLANVAAFAQSGEVEPHSIRGGAGVRKHRRR